VGQTVSSIDYFDSSALVKRHIAETGSAWVQARCNDPVRIIATVDLSRIEVAAAFAANLRGKFITQTEYQEARTKLVADAQKCYLLIPVTTQHVDEAIELTARHKLRGYDAVHLACALHLNRALPKDDLPSLTLVAADDDLLKAAQTKGLETENPNHHL
jgi:predicted nucleic acid-binding protein